MADTTEARRLANALDDETDSRESMYGFEYVDNRKAAAMLRALADDNDRMRRLLDTRPALNAGTLSAYVEWTGKVYASDLGKKPDALLGRDH